MDVRAAAVAIQAAARGRAARAAVRAAWRAYAAYFPDDRPRLPLLRAPPQRAHPYALAARPAPPPAPLLDSLPADLDALIDLARRRPVRLH